MEFGAMFRFKRSEVQPGLIEAFKRDLVKHQRGGEKYGFGKGQTVTLYREQADTIEIPRYYALREFPPIQFQDKTTQGQPAPFTFTRDLRPNQVPVVTEFMSRLGKRGSEYGGILCSPCGCHAAGELILMVDGTRKRAEEVMVGDLLMGIDGPRRVLELHRGRQRMAKVIPNKGEPFVVNIGHILTVLWSVSDGARKDGEVIDVTVAEWLLSSRNFQRHTVLYRPKVDQFLTDFTTRDRPISPYHLGLLLGDGTITYTTGITTADPEIANECYRITAIFGLQCRKETTGGRCPTYYINSGEAGGRKRGSNTLMTALRSLGLFGTRSESKFVPLSYLTAPRASRLEILAGLLDTDGCVSCGGFDWISKSKRLADDVVFLCRSLGLAAYTHPCEKRDQHGNGGTYHRVSISGACDVIPTLIPRKRAPARRINKDAQRVGFRVDLLPEDDYYGFVVDGDHRYLMGDFTWTHNTGKTIEALHILSKLGRTAIVLVHAEFLMKQWREAILGNATTNPQRLPFTDLRPEDVGTIQQDEEEWQGKKIVLAMVETLIKREYSIDFYENFGVVVLDEVHRHGAMEWHKAMTKFPAKYRIGLSATPARGDGLWDVIKFHIGNVIARGGESEKATVYVVPTGVAVHDEFYKQYDADGEETDNIALARLLKVLCKSDYRNRLIAKEIFKAYKAGRRVLILSDRLAHLDALEELFVADWKKETPQEEQMALAMGNKGPAEDVISHYVGGVSQTEIERAKSCKVMFGTYQYAKEGLDDPMLDTLILATPNGNVIQAVGRILRTVEGKKTPLVIDIHDEKTDACRDFLDRRMKGYAERGYDVKKIEKTP